MKNKNLIDKTYILISIAIIVSIIPLYIISFNSHPCLDDWTYSLFTHWEWDRSHNIFNLVYQALREVWLIWNTWQGTYSSAFIMSLQPSIFGENLYFITGFLYITLLICSTTFFFCYISRKIMKDKKESLWIGIPLGFICSFFSLQFMPSAIEGLYWFNGATHYSFFHSAILLFICAFIELQITTKKTKYTIICSLLAILIEGGNHVTAFMLLLFVIAVMVWMFINKKKQPLKENIIVLTCGLIFFAINAFSPGNAIRKESYGEGLSVLEVIINSKNSALGFIKEWTNIKTLIMIVIIIPLINELVKKSTYSFKYPIEVFVLSLLVIGVMITPVMYGQKDAGAGRNLNIYYDVFLLLVIINELYIIGYLKHKEILNIGNVSYKYFPLFCVVLILGLIWTFGTEIKGYQAYIELVDGTAQRHHDAYLERLEIIENDTSGEVVFEPLPESRLLSTYDLVENSDLWPNTDFALYHYIKRASVK